MPKVIDEQAIFTATLDTLVKQGYEKATTKEIAAAAEVNETTLFRKYGSKAALIEQAINFHLAHTPLHELNYTGDLEADLIAIVQSYIETNQAYGEIIPILISEMPRYPELKKMLDTPFTIIQSIAAIIHQYQDEGLLKRETGLTAISALVGPIIVSNMFLRANSTLPFTEIDPKTHVESFLHGRKCA